jgi:hypothetical protein
VLHDGATAGGIKLARESVVNVLDYGAVGDGVTDDTAAINNAISTGKNIIFGAGTYLVTGIEILNTSNVTLMGNGDVTIKANGAYNHIALSILGQSRGITVQGLKFEGIKDNSVALTDPQNSGILLKNDPSDVTKMPSQISILDCEFKYFYGNGIQVGHNGNTDDNQHSIIGLHIDRCVFQQNYIAAIKLQRLYEFSITNCRFVNNAYTGYSGWTHASGATSDISLIASPNGAGTYTYGCEDGIVDNCFMQKSTSDTNTSELLDCSYGNTSNISITSCSFSAGSSYNKVGVRMRSSNSNTITDCSFTYSSIRLASECNNITIADNTIHVGHINVSLAETSTTMHENIAIVNNTITSASGSSAVIYLLGVHDSNISGNIIKDTYLTGSSYSAIRTQLCSNVTISGNKIDVKSDSSENYGMLLQRLNGSTVSSNEISLPYRTVRLYTDSDAYTDYNIDTVTSVTTVQDRVRGYIEVSATQKSVVYGGHEGSITIKVGSVTATDDGNGNLTGTGVSDGEIDYKTGRFRLVLSSATTGDVLVSATVGGRNNSFTGNVAKGYGHTKWYYNITTQCNYLSSDNNTGDLDKISEVLFEDTHTEIATGSNADIYTGGGIHYNDLVVIDIYQYNSVGVTKHSKAYLSSWNGLGGAINIQVENAWDQGTYTFPTITASGTGGSFTVNVAQATGLTQRYKYKVTKLNTY